MIITVASFKGGVGKTTTAVHLATFLSQRDTTLLVDGDPNRSASTWGRKGRLPFPVIDERLAAKEARHYESIVIDTRARPDKDDLSILIEGCDLLVLPTTPDALALDALILLVDVLREFKSDRFRILLSIVPPRPSRDGDEARQSLSEAGLPLFKTKIPRLVAFQKAALSGVPVYGVADPRAKESWGAYENVGKELLK
jgi:chromosome partitioning protein